ncbi:MAG: hypothetical protein R3254_07170 [Thiomicrorhabdus sp.]|nr:hypothetical protein [Thiomicrorhabdus sp.]
MAIINPNLASAALNLQNIQNGSQLKPSDSSSPSQQAVKNTPINGNSTVTLSDPMENVSTDYLQLNNQQTINQNNPSENVQNNNNETTTGLTYASTLETQSNFLAFQSSNKSNS